MVAMPCGQKLHIEMHLNIETSKNQGVSVNDTLRFDNNGSLCKRRKVDGYEFEVNIAWYPDSSGVRRNRSRKVNVENLAEH